MWSWDGYFILWFMSHMNWNRLSNMLRWRFTMYNSSKKFLKRCPHWIANSVNKCQYLNIFWNLISDDKCYLEVWLNRHMISYETEISHLDNYLRLCNNFNPVNLVLFRFTLTSCVVLLHFTRSSLITEQKWYRMMLCSNRSLFLSSLLSLNFPNLSSTAVSSDIATM